MERLSSKELASLITDNLNTFNTKERNKDFCDAMATEHRTLQQSFTGLCLTWIEFMGQTDPDFQRRYLDGRNEYSNEVCSKISAFMKENNIFPNLPCI